MKVPSPLAVAVLLTAGFTASARAQDDKAAKQEKLVDFKDIKVAVQKTPDFTLKGGTTDKRWKPKDWIEIEPEFKTARSATDKKAEVLPELTFKYYVFLNSPNADNRRILTTDVVHTNVPIDEVSHSVVYISPSVIKRVTGKPEGNPQLILYYAVEVTSGGETVGFFSKGPKGTAKSPNEAGAKWWEGTGGNIPQQEPALLSKPQTPFAPLWGDYHADVRSK